MPLHESGEDYLETIYLLSKKKDFVRSIDIATELNYSKASISRAMKLLREAGLITMADDGQIKLTKLGYQTAEDVYSRHTLLTDFFTQELGVNPVTAEKDACRIEHVISEETFLRLLAYMNKKGYKARK